jgi:hypothetical protein
VSNEAAARGGGGRQGSAVRCQGSAAGPGEGDDEDAAAADAHVRTRQQSTSDNRPSHDASAGESFRKGSTAASVTSVSSSSQRTAGRGVAFSDVEAQEKERRRRLRKLAKLLKSNGSGVPERQRRTQ